MALPVATRLVKYHLLTALLAGIAALNAIHALHLFKLPLGNAAMTLSFYLFWALLGYKLAQAKDRIDASALGVALLVSVTCFSMLLTFHPSESALDLQKHKFPPNYIFFVFNCVCIVAILFALQAFRRQQALADWLANQRWFKTFMTSWYSIYLWQGLGYTIAIRFGAATGLPKVAVWGAAFLLSVALGILASPLEKIRTPRASVLVRV
jgi:hypothetical protein